MRARMCHEVFQGRERRELARVDAKAERQRAAHGAAGAEGDDGVASIESRGERT